jgi:hypothetical protein
MGQTGFPEASAHRRGKADGVVAPVISDGPQDRGSAPRLSRSAHVKCRMPVAIASRSLACLRGVTLASRPLGPETTGRRVVVTYATLPRLLFPIEAVKA